MICVITDPIDLANYIDVWNLKQRHPSERVCHIKWGDLSGILASETLYLLAHGSPHALEGMSADKLAALLVSKGLKNPLKKIKLLVCESGLTNRGGLPFCQQLADALVKQGGPTTVVIGFDGDTAVTDGTGTTYAKDKRQRDFPNWNEFMTSYGTQFQLLDQKAESMPFPDEKTILKNAEGLYNDSKDIFKWLYTNNKLYTKPSITGKTYGIPGQIFR